MPTYKDMILTINKHYSVKEMANAWQCDASTLHRIKSGETTNPTMKVKRQITGAYNKCKRRRTPQKTPLALI